MVHKFLTKEQTYGTLLKEVKTSENLLEMLRRENDEKSDILHTLKIDNDNKDDNNKQKSTNEDTLEIL